MVWLEIGLVRLGNIPMTACPCGGQLRVRIGIVKWRRKVGQKVNPGTGRVGRVETYQIMNKSGGRFSYSIPIYWSAGDRRFGIEAREATYLVLVEQTYVLSRSP